MEGAGYPLVIWDTLFTPKGRHGWPCRVGRAQREAQRAGMLWGRPPRPASRTAHTASWSDGHIHTYACVMCLRPHCLTRACTGLIRPEHALSTPCHPAVTHMCSHVGTSTLTSSSSALATSLPGTPPQGWSLLHTVKLEGHVPLAEVSSARPPHPAKMPVSQHRARHHRHLSDSLHLPTPSSTIQK